MKALLLSLFFLFSLGHEIRFEVVLPESAQSILCNYRNANFSQEVRGATSGIHVSVWSRNFTDLAMPDRVYTDQTYLDALDPALAAVYRNLLTKGSFLKDFLKNLSIFLRSSVTYSQEDLPQDALSVLRQGKGSCIGFTCLTQVLLRCAGIQSRPVRGFYLTFIETRAEPVSHRWLEITLPGRFHFFYDPQYQSFSGKYILVSDQADFDRIEKFHGRVVTINQGIRSY